jgi:hypothetical protein
MRLSSSFSVTGPTKLKKPVASGHTRSGHRTRGQQPAVVPGRRRVGRRGGLVALRQMDDRKGVPVLTDVWHALTHRMQDRI